MAIFLCYVSSPEGIKIILRKTHQNTDRRMMMRSVGARNGGIYPLFIEAVKRNAGNMMNHQHLGIYPL